VTTDTSGADAIAANIARVRNRIALAASRTGRKPTAIRLIGVSKKFGAQRARAAVTAGLTDLGENRVQEAVEKISAINAPDRLRITWHLIGHLQSNKARKAVLTFDWIHSIDSLELLTRLDEAAQSEATHPKLLVQVDLASEATKHGASVDDTRRILDAASDCTAVKVCGLMVLPPWSANAELARPFFARLRELRDGLVQGGVAPQMLGELSMGMSHDFEVAIEEGATIVRVGTAIFGPRPR
jgi:pyridoxal phosphate enzyme (YggS family)